MPIDELNIEVVLDEIARFQVAVDALRGSDEWKSANGYRLTGGTASSGAVRRASMDLTRALANLRRT